MTVTFHDTRLGPGELTLGAEGYGVQIASCKITSDTSTEEGTPTLGQPEPAAEVSTSYTLEGNAIHDFENATGFVRYCWDNAGTSVAFEFTPKTGGDKITGNCTIVATDIGGDVAQQLQVDFAFPIAGKPTIAAGTKAAPTTK